MNRLLTLAAGLLVLAAIGYWYYDQTERRQRSAEAMRAELGEFLTANGARYGSLTYDRRTNSVTVTGITWSQESNGMARHLTLDRAEIVAGDIDAFQTVFRSASYAPDETRVGDFVKLATAIDLRGLEIKNADGTLAVSHLHLDAPALRQFGFKPSRQGLAQAGTDFVAGDVGKSLKFQKGTLKELRITRGNESKVTLEALELGEFDAGKLSQLAVNGFNFEETGLRTKVEGLTVSNLGLKNWLEGLRSGSLTLADGWFSSAAWDGHQSPTFDAVKVLGFSLSDGETAPQLSIDAASLTDLVRVGEFVAAGTLRIKGLEFPVRGESPWSKALSNMGYKKLRLNVVSRSTYDPASKVSETAEFMVEVENAGRIFGSSRLENVEIGDELRELDLKGFVAEGGLEKILGTWRIARLEVGYKDLSLIERAFELALERLGKTSEDLIHDYSAQIEALREQYGDGPFLTQLSEQMKVFLEEPNSIVFRMVPPEPVVISQALLAALDNPEDLAKLMGLTVTANAPVTE